MIITIISGASKGIGAAIASDLVNPEDTFLLLSGRTEIKDEKFATENITRVQVNFEEPSLVLEKTRSFFRDQSSADQINIVLCASQLGSHVSSGLDFDLEEISDLYRSNLLGNLAIIKAASDYSNSNTKIRIVFFGGGGAAYAYPEFFGYALSKAATVRAVENLAILLRKITGNSSIIALAPGAVKTDMLKKVMENGGYVKTVTDISEPVSFVRSFINDNIPSLELNGMFLHVRDKLNDINDKVAANNDIFKLRRIQ